MTFDYQAYMYARMMQMIHARPADVVVDPDGTVWVSREPTHMFMPASYIEYEELREQDRTTRRGTRHNPKPGYRGGNHGTPGREVRRGPYFDASKLRQPDDYNAVNKRRRK